MILTLDALFAPQEDILVLANASLVHQDNILMEALVQVRKEFFKREKLIFQRLYHKL